jgi:allantoinase
MPTSDLVLVSRRVVTPDGERPAAVVVSGEHIVDVVDPEDAPQTTTLRDVGDLAVLPGFVDAHVHVNEPGRTEWEGYTTATRAALAGGITTLVDMPLNSVPPTTTVDALEQKRAAAEGKLHVDVGLWGGVVPGSEGELADLYAAGVLGFKAFTCDSGVPEYGHFWPERLGQLAARIAAVGATLLVHAEDPATVDDATAAVAASGADRRAYATWLDGRPARAEERAIAAVIEAARAAEARVHVLHLSAAGGVELVTAARGQGVAITVETCPHYLTLAAEEVPDGATSHKCAPPIRDAANRDRLWAALADGTIDAVVSDHSPAPPAIKAIDTGDFVDAWGGIASLQLGPALVWTEARRRGHDLSDLVRWMSAGPARVAGLTRKGTLAAGADADLVVFDPDATWTVDAAALHHRHPVSPYDGRELTGRAVTTYLRGREVDPLGVPTGRLRPRGDL